MITRAVPAKDLAVAKSTTQNWNQPCALLWASGWSSWDAGTSGL